MSARSPLLRLCAALVLLAFAAPVRAEVGAGAAPAATAPEPAAPDAAGAPPSLEPGAVAPLPSLAPVAVDPRPVLVQSPEVEKPKRTPLAKRWWFWAGLGTAAVGVVLAAIYLGPRQPYSGNAMPGVEPVF